MTELSNLLDPKIKRILDVFYTNKSKYYHVTQLAKAAQVPPATTLRLIKNLLKSGMIKKTNVGKIKIYSFKDTEKNNELMRLL